jgi:hypothetical protein
MLLFIGPRRHRHHSNQAANHAPDWLTTTSSSGPLLHDLINPQE